MWEIGWSKFTTMSYGFIKLHETLDIKFKIIKAQMKRLEERIEQREAAAKH